MALAQITVEAPASVLAGALGRAWDQVSGTVRGALLPWLAWWRLARLEARQQAGLASAPWRAWASMLGAATWARASAAVATRPDAMARVPAQVGDAVVGLGTRVTASLAERADRQASRTRMPRRGPHLPLRTVFRVLVWTVVVGLVGAFAAGLAVPYWYQLHGQRLLVVTSGSMSPFVEAGDVAVLQLIDDPSQLRVGQVATFYPPGSSHMVTHRIVDLRMYPVMVQNDETGEMEPQSDASGNPVLRPYIFTKGDANETQDPNATPLSGVRGVVVDAKPGWGRWLAWAQSKIGRFALLAPPLVLLASLELVDSLAERRHRPVRRPAQAPEVTDALGTL